MNIGSKVLVVCIGNICRSPAAEGFIANHFKRHAIEGVVRSAGIHAMVGDPAAKNTIKVMQDVYDIDVSQHRAAQITESMAREHDLILVMDDEQVMHIKKIYPFASGKVHRLGKWRQVNVADPYKNLHDEQVFQSCIALIHDCVSDWTKKFW